MGSPYGHFSQDGSRFVITTPNIPRHWYNYLWNDGYMAFTSQVGFGEGFAQDTMGRRVPLVAGRAVYLLDGDSFWTANGIPVEREYAFYQCEHGLGYSEITLEYRSVRSSFRIFVPEEGSCEVWSVRLCNHRAESCTLKVIPYCKTDLDGVYKPQGYNLATGWFDPALSAVLGRAYMAFGSAQDTEIYGFLTADSSLTGYDSRKNAFIGTYGEESRPAAVAAGGCTGSDCNAEKLCFALESTVRLGPGEERELHFIVGAARSREEIAALRRRLFAPGAVRAACRAATRRFAGQTDGVVIRTPDRQLDCLFGWLKHQANMGSRWARVRHNGFRDLTQDTECFGSVNPALAWQRLKRVMTYQYANGYAPRTFINGEIRDNRFSDNTVWLTFAVHALLMEIGNPAILAQTVPFNDGSEGSVYAHMERSVAFLSEFRGLHGLIRIWGGDWNDTLNHAGLRGKGVSVWLSMAWYKACRQFAEIAALTGRTQDADRVGKWADEMRGIVHAHGWDGGHYLTAYTDDDIPLGSSRCEEGKIFLVPQVWAVLSGIGQDGREETAMQAVEKYLETDLGARISRPSYTHYVDAIGSMTEKPAGVNENGGVYLHPCVWKLAADCQRGRNALVQEDLEKILPFDQKWAEKKCEPYILCNCYFTGETGYRRGTAGQSWRTASGPWLVKALVEYVFGLKATMEGLRLEPCLPPDWPSCSIRKKFRGAVYHIVYTQIGTGENRRITRVEVNGAPFCGSTLPCRPGETYEVAATLE